jgi:hypothetical protein
MINIDELKQILDLARDHELNELELEGEGYKIRIKKGGQVVVSHLPAVSAAPPPPPAAVAAAPSSAGPAARWSCPTFRLSRRRPLRPQPPWRRPQAQPVPRPRRLPRWTSMPSWPS